MCFRLFSCILHIIHMMWALQKMRELGLLSYKLPVSLYWKYSSCMHKACSFPYTELHLSCVIFIFWGHMRASEQVKTQIFSLLWSCVFETCWNSVQYSSFHFIWFPSTLVDVSGSSADNVQQLVSYLACLSFGSLQEAHSGCICWKEGWWQWNLPDEKPK